MVVVTLLLNDYNAMQTHLKQFIDFTQLMNIISQARRAQKPYFFQKVCCMQLFCSV